MVVSAELLGELRRAFLEDPAQLRSVVDALEEETHRPPPGDWCVTREQSQLMIAITEHGSILAALDFDVAPQA